MRLDEIPGNSQSIDTIYGPAVAEAKDGDVFVELGVYYGRSLAMLATFAGDAGKSLNIYGVDLWRDAGHITRNASHPYEPAPYYECASNIATIASETQQHMSLSVGDTALAACLFDDASVTLAFIDGDHSYEGCKRDIAAWWGKIKPGGLLAGHDYSHEYPGVMQAVTEAFPEYVHHGERDCGICWYVRKPL
jgi:hypothetical protein